MKTFIRKFLVSLCLSFCTTNSFAQYNNVCDAAYTAFNYLIEAFLESPTDRIRNEEIYNHLDELQNTIAEIHVSKEERSKLNALQANINVVKDFMSPISNKYNAHLSNNSITRLQTIFGKDFTQKKLNVNCPSDEVQFIEVKVGSLIICYFHCISKKTENGLRIKFHAVSGNNTESGEYGALKNEYTPIIHNAGKKYTKVTRATIVGRF